MDVWWGRVVVSTIVRLLLLLLLLILLVVVVWHEQWFGKQHCRPVFEYVLSFEIVFLPFKYFMVFHCCFVNQRKTSILTILFSLHRYHRAAYGTRVWLSTLFLLTHVIHSCNQSVSQSFIYGMSYRTEWSLFTFNANVFALLFVYLLIWLPFGEYFSFFGVKHDTSIPCQLTLLFQTVSYDIAALGHRVTNTQSFEIQIGVYPYPARYPHHP